LVVGAVALVATGVGAVIGAAAAAATTVAGIASVATIAAVAGAAAGVLTLAAGLTTKKPSAQATGSPTDFSADPDAGIPLAIGRTGTAGDINARFGFDTKDKGDNDRQSFVATLSLGPIDAIELQTVDKARVDYTATGAAIGAFAGFMWSMTQLGAMPEPAALGFGAGAGSPPGWTAQHKMSGKAAATWTLRFDPNGKVYAAGVPAPMWTLRGAKCYDPTRDSTYPGGVGAHRMADPANTAAYDAAIDTWEWSEDPYLLGLRWAHGVWQRDRSNPNSKYQRVMGMGANWSGIDVAAFVEGRNIAHANGWKVGGMIYSGDDKWDTMKKILQAGMGEPLALGARISCLVNAPKVSLANITIDDVIGTASVAGTQPRRNRINTITPRYRLEENNWQLLPGTPITVAEYVIADRGKRSKVQDYPFIQQTPQVATAVRYDIENAREFGPITLPLKLVWMGYKPGDCVTVTLPEVGLNGQPVLLLNRELDPSQGIVTMTARSETAGKHPFALGQTTTPPPTPGLTGPPLIPVPGANAWAITGTSIQSTSGTVPALVIEGARDASAIDGVVFDYRKFADGLGPDDGWITAGIEPPSVATKVITGVQASVPYQVSIRYSRGSGNSSRLIIGPVGTGAALVALVPPGAAIGGTIGQDGTVVGGVPAVSMIDALRVLLSTDDPDQLVANAQAFIDRSEELLVSQLAAQTLAEARKQRTDFLTHLNGVPIGARVTQEIIERLAQGSALAQQIVDTSAAITGPTGPIAAAVTQMTQAVADEAGARAKAVTDLGASITGPAGPIQAVATQLTQAIATEASARVQAIQDLATTITGPSGAINAAVTQLQQAISDEAGARAQAVQGLNADVAGAKAAISAAVTNLTQAIADETSARTEALSQLQASIIGPSGALTAAVSQFNQAVATETDARAQADANLKAEITGPDGPIAAAVSRSDQAVADEASARAQALSDLSASILGPSGAVQAAVTQLTQAVADETSARTTALTLLSSTVGQHSSSIELLFETLNGEQAIAQLMVTVDDGGTAKITGFKIDGEERLFVVAADKFVVGNSQIFQVDTQTGIVSMNDVVVGRLRANSVDTDALVDNSVTGFVYVDGLSGQIDSGEDSTTSDALTLTSDGGLVVIDVSFDVRFVAGQGAQFTLTVMRDGGAVSRAYPVGYGSSTANGFPNSFRVKDTPPAGTHSYNLLFGRAVPGSAGLIYENGEIDAQEFKK
jgi:hypothetical protein